MLRQRPRARRSSYAAIGQLSFVDVPDQAPRDPVVG